MTAFFGDGHFLLIREKKVRSTEVDMHDLLRSHCCCGPVAHMSVVLGIKDRGGSEENRRADETTPSRSESLRISVVEALEDDGESVSNFEFTTSRLREGLIVGRRSIEMTQRVCGIDDGPG